MDLALPKSTIVQTVDRAEVGEPPSLGAKLKQMVTGKVERKARVKVERDQNDISGLSERGSSGVYDPYFVQMEFETIQSETVLGRVVEDLNLQETWAKRMAAAD